MGKIWGQHGQVEFEVCLRHSGGDVEEQYETEFPKSGLQIGMWWLSLYRLLVKQCKLMRTCCE